MRSISGGKNHSRNPAHSVGGEFVWFNWLGYLRYRDLVRVGALVCILLTGVITVLTSDLTTLVFLAIIAVLALKFASLEQYAFPRRRVVLHTEDDLFIAEHVESGVVRHGKTPEDALADLSRAFELGHQQPD